MAKDPQPNLFEEFKWIKSSNGEKVTGAIQGGCKHGEMYIGRAFHVADLIPGKFPCSHDVLYLPWGGKEYYKKEYEILVSDEKARYAWIPSPKGQVPQEAIPGGYTSTGEILYIGRKIHMGVMTPGKIHPSHDCLYVSFGGYEYCYKHNYEILVSRGPCEWISETKGINNLSLDGFLTPPDYVYHHYEDLQKQMTYYAQKYSVIHISIPLKSQYQLYVLA